MSETKAKTRDRLPLTPRWGEDETRVLYNRWGAMKTRARVKEQPFPWMKFIEFFDLVLEKAPEDYTPARYRIEWGESGYDYRPEAISFVRKTPSDPCAFVAELTALLLTTAGTLDDLVAEAANRALSS